MGDTTISITTYRRRVRPIRSTYRAAAYNRSFEDTVLLEQFFDSRVKPAAVGQEAALMHGVLDDALLCFHKKFEADERRMQSAYEAEDWFFSDNSRGLFSFVAVCDALRLEPHSIRQKLRHWTSSRLDTAPGKLRALNPTGK